MRAIPFSVSAALVLLSSSLGPPPRAWAQTDVQTPETIRRRVARPEASTKVTPSTAAVSVARAVPAPSVCPSPPPVHPCPPCEGAKRRVLADGTVETSYTDGTVKRMTPGGTTLIRYADGTSEERSKAGTVYRDRVGNVVSRQSNQIMYMEVPSADPPDPPTSGSQLARWLARHNADVLAALSALLANEPGGPESLQQYLAGEADLGLYAQIAHRTALLDRLLTP
jgi:hypothetical protein